MRTKRLFSETSEVAEEDLYLSRDTVNLLLENGTSSFFCSNWLYFNRISYQTTFKIDKNDDLTNI